MSKQGSVIPVTFIGRLKEDPKARFKNDELSYVDVSLVINNSGKNYQVEFYNVRCFPPLANQVVKDCKKGYLVQLHSFIEQFVTEENKRHTNFIGHCVNVLDRPAQGQQ